MSDMIIDVPISVKGEISSSERKENVKKDSGTDKQTNLLKEIVLATGVVAIIWKGLQPLLEPVLKLLQAITVILFSILQPLLIPVLNFLMDSLKGWMLLAPILRAGLEKIMSMLGEDLTWIWANLLKPIWDGLVEAFGVLSDIGQWIWDGIIIPGFMVLFTIGVFLFNSIVNGFMILYTAGKFIFDRTISGFMVLFTIGNRIWESILKPAFQWFRDIGNKIWNILKSAFEGAVNIIRNAISNLIQSIIRSVSFFGGGGGSTRVSDFIIKPDGQVLQTARDDFLIGTKNPENLFNKGGLVININNPVVREERDINKLANEVSIVLQKNMRSRY
jgi:hypothetical protein